MHCRYFQLLRYFLGNFRVISGQKHYLDSPVLKHRNNFPGFGFDFLRESQNPDETSLDCHERIQGGSAGQPKLPISPLVITEPNAELKRRRHYSLS